MTSKLWRRKGWQKAPPKPLNLQTRNSMNTSKQTPSVATSGVLCDDRAWMPSHREEVISALWFIVAFVALDAGCPRWVFLTFFIKACMDAICSIQCTIREWWKDDSHNPES